MDWTVQLVVADIVDSPPPTLMTLAVIAFPNDIYIQYLAGRLR